MDAVELQREFTARLRQVSLIRWVLKHHKALPKSSFENTYAAHLVDFCIREYTDSFDGDWVQCYQALKDGKKEGVFHQSIQKTEEEFEKEFEERLNIANRLPREILDTVEDVRFFCLGYTSEETEKVLKKYGSLKRTLKRLNRMKRL